MEKGGWKPTIFLTKNRKGSHVGMIISFVVFITFVVFLYSVIKPAVNTGEDKSTVLEYIGQKIEENVSANLTKVGVQISSNKNPGQRCVQLKSFLAWLEIGAPYPIITRNELGQVQESYFGSGTAFANLVINRVDRNNLFFEVYFSPAFDGLEANPITAPPCAETADYNFSLSTTHVYVFERNMYNLMDYYENNYENLKNELNIPSNNEFGFGFKQSNGTVINVGERGDANVYAKEVPIQYFDDKATLQSGFINVRVW
jgi:hypothetical protein